MKKLTVVMLCVLLAACEKPDEEKRLRETGELRHSLFVECMELASKNPRAGDDDVADIVSECSTQAYYMAEQMSGA